MKNAFAALALCLACATDIRLIAQTLGRRQEGETLIAALAATMREARAIQLTYPRRPRILILFDGLSERFSTTGRKPPGTPSPPSSAATTPPPSPA